MALPNSFTTSLVPVPHLPIYGFPVRTFILLLINLICFLPAFAGTTLIRDVLEEKFRAFEQFGTPDCMQDFLNTHVRMLVLSPLITGLLTTLIGKP